MYVIIGLFIFLLCYVLTPAMGRIAWHIGAVDVPLDGRRMHRRSIPRNGGVAIFLSFLLGLLVLDEWDSFLTSFAFGCSVMLLAGLADDIFWAWRAAKAFVPGCSSYCGCFGQWSGYGNLVSSRRFMDRFIDQRTQFY